MEENNDSLLSIDEVVRLLKISKVTLFNLRQKGLIKPTHKVGRKPLFQKSLLLKQVELVKY